MKFSLGVEELCDSSDQLGVHEERFAVAGGRQPELSSGGFRRLPGSRAAHSPRVQDLPFFPEVPPGQGATLRVPAHVDDDVNHVLLGDQVRGQGQVE